MAQATDTTLEADSLGAKIQAILDKEPGQMTPMIARQLNVSEAEVLRHMPGEGISTELDGARISDLIQELDKLGKVHVICSNGDVVLESYGYFGGFSITGGFLNVQTDTLDMHIFHLRLKYAFALIKPSHTDLQETFSFQFFNAEGRSAFKAFLYKSVTEAAGDEIAVRKAAWEELREKYRLAK
jgi:putative heme iron utilization protein